MFDGLFQNIPPITKLIMGLQLLGLGLLSLEYLTRYDLYFNFNRIIYEGEVKYIFCDTVLLDSGVENGNQSLFSKENEYVLHI